MKKLLVIFLCTLSGYTFAVDYTVQSIPNPKAANKHAFVSNPDGILKTKTVQDVNAYLDALQSETGAEVTIVAVNSIGSNELKPFATDLFKAWGVGQAKRDNGLLVLFVLNQRKITFES